MELGALYIPISALAEFPSAVTVADSHKLAHSIKCAIYGNISMVPKKIKTRNDCQKRRPKHECSIGSTFVPSRGPGDTAGAARNCLSARQLQDRVCVCTHFYILGFSFIFLSLCGVKTCLQACLHAVVFYMHLFLSY